jgi:outer membrane protein OmpA-like peptidoglycan-associated protein
LPEAAKRLLDPAIADLKKDENLRLQLVAYASGGDDAGSQARRLSLSRALAVRSYLIDQGVRSTRMDVRALGNRVPSGPPDRVDVVVMRR